MNIDDLTKKFKNEAELLKFCEAQTSAILQLTKEKNELVEKVKHLESMLMSENIFESVSDEESICLLELRKLHDLALQQQLTFEDTKKVEIYTKTLHSIKERKAKKKEKDPAEMLDSESLLDVLNAKPH